jgi:archaellum biogenesis ATPase FlaH
VASLPDGADVNDVLVEGGSTDLHAHLAEAEPYTPPEPELDVSEPATERKEPEPGGGPTVEPLLGTEEPDPMEWRVADFVPEDHLTMLIGDGGTGKSILALHLALCICTGRPFLGMGTRKGRVLYIDHELDREEQLRRVHRIARAMGIDAADSSLSDRFQYWRPTHPLGTEEHQENLLGAVGDHQIDLVILDSLTMGAEGDVTDVADVVPIMQHLRQWPTTVAIDHVSHSTAKGSAAQARAFGSVFKRNAARSSLTLAQSETGGYALQQEKSNFSEGDGRLTYAVEWGEEEITFEAISDADERAQGLLSDLSSKDVTLVGVKEEYEALGGAVLAENVVDWREGRDDVSSVAKKTVQNHFAALKRSGDLIGAKGEGVKPKAAEHDPAQEAPF